MNVNAQQGKCTGLISSVWKQLPGYLHSPGCLCPANAHLQFQSNELELTTTTLRNYQIYLDVLIVLLPFSSLFGAKPIQCSPVSWNGKKMFSYQEMPFPYHISLVCFTASYVNESVQTSFLISFSVLPGSYIVPKHITYTLKCHCKHVWPMWSPVGPLPHVLLFSG